MNFIKNIKSLKNKILYNLVFLCSAFPIWLIKFNIELTLNLIVILVITLLFFLHNYLYLHLYNKKKLYYLYLAFILTLGIDNSLSLFSDVIAPNFENIIKITNLYFFGLIVLILICTIISFLLVYLGSKGIIIALTFVLTLLVQTLFFGDKTLKNFPDFEIAQINNYNDKITIVLIMDQMAGLNSDASKNNNINNFDDYALGFSKKFNANIFTNIYSLCGKTDQSISKLLNFDTNDNCTKSNKKLISKKNNFFNEYVMLKNSFFDKFNSVSVFQNYFLDYCTNKKVYKCDQYNQFKKYEYIQNFKNNNLSKIFGAWKHHGSILANIKWKFLLYYNFIDSFEQSGGEKGSFVSLLKNVEKDIKSNKYDLIFVHSLATHSPYGFDINCKYDGKKYANYRNLSDEKKNRRSKYR